MRASMARWPLADGKPRPKCGDMDADFVPQDFDRRALSALRERSNRAGLLRLFGLIGTLSGSGALVVLQRAVSSCCRRWRCMAPSSFSSSPLCTKPSTVPPSVADGSTTQWLLLRLAAAAAARVFPCVPLRSSPAYTRSGARPGAGGWLSSGEPRSVASASDRFSVLDLAGARTGPARLRLCRRSPSCPPRRVGAGSQGPGSNRRRSRVDCGIGASGLPLLLLLWLGPASVPVAVAARLSGCRARSAQNYRIWRSHPDYPYLAPGSFLRLEYELPCGAPPRSRPAVPCATGRACSVTVGARRGLAGLWRCHASDLDRNGTPMRRAPHRSGARLILNL